MIAAGHNDHSMTGIHALLLFYIEGRVEMRSVDGSAGNGQLPSHALVAGRITAPEYPHSLA